MSPSIAHHFGGGVYAKETLIPAGMVLVQHKHAFDHLSILARGTVEVIVEGEEATALTGPACLTIKANRHHSVKALSDVVWYCVHATDCTDPAHVDETLIAGSDEDMQAIAESLL